MAQREHQHEPDDEEDDLLEGDFGGTHRPAPVGQELREPLGLRAPDQQHGVDQNERDADRRDHRRRARDVPQRAQTDPLDEHAEDARRRHGRHEEHHERADQRESGQGLRDRGDAHEVQHHEPHEGPRHEDAEVGEVDQLDDAVHHGEAEREQGVHHAKREPVDDLLEENIHRAHDRVFI